MVVKNPPANAGNMDSIPELVSSPKVGNGNPLQCSYVGNTMDRGAWRTTVHGVIKDSNLVTKQLITTRR